MKIERAKELDMVDYLSKIGHEPVKISGFSYWYKSPLRDEKTASFKVNKQMNRWFDFGTGTGGNLIDFGILYHKCSTSDFLGKLKDSNLVVDGDHRPVASASSTSDLNDRIKIISTGAIESFSLQKYLEKRRIPLVIAFEYCQEVRYSLRDKNYFAIGFKNGAGGYELRNEFIKASSSPKDTTFINNGSNHMAVFEGFFNFLSYRSLYAKQEDPLRNYLVLNSTSFFEKSIGQMEQHDRVHLYLDTDKTGQICTQKALGINPEKFKDERGLYQKQNDLNEWLMQTGQSKKQSHHQKP